MFCEPTIYIVQLQNNIWLIARTIQGVVQYMIATTVVQYVTLVLL